MKRWKAVLPGAVVLWGAAGLVSAAAGQETPAAPVPPSPAARPAPRPRPAPHARVAVKTLRSGDGRYDRGARALDEGHWDEARQIFAEVAQSKDARADGALYWKAYAENRLGRREEAVATLALLRQEYPSSEWLNDAQALGVEIQQQAGKAVDPNAEANEELKLMAINGLLNSDAERAVPLLEKILKSPSSPRLRDRALFVLTQNKSPQAQQLLLATAKSGSNPDLQLRALRYLAMSGSKNVSAELVAIYNASHSPALKRQAISSLMMAKSVDDLFTIAKNEQDPGLRGEAIRGLSMLRAQDKLAQLYQAGIDREAVLQSMFISGDPGKLLEIARTEKDPKLRGAAIHSLGLMHSGQGAEGLAALYGTEQDPAVKKQIIEALWLQRNAKALVDIAKKESNPEVKRDIVQKLSMMKSKESADYMMELLK